MGGLYNYDPKVSGNYNKFVSMMGNTVNAPDIIFEKRHGVSIEDYRKGIGRKLTVQEQVRKEIVKPLKKILESRDDYVFNFIRARFGQLKYKNTSRTGRQFNMSLGELEIGNNDVERALRYREEDAKEEALKRQRQYRKPTSPLDDGNDKFRYKTPVGYFFNFGKLLKLKKNYGGEGIHKFRSQKLMKVIASRGVPGGYRMLKAYMILLIHLNL